MKFGVLVQEVVFMKDLTRKVERLAYTITVALEICALVM